MSLLPESNLRRREPLSQVVTGCDAVSFRPSAYEDSLIESSWTVPMSPHEYTEWRNRAEYMYLTAAGLFQCLLMSILNGETGLRLEFIYIQPSSQAEF
eukprot:scaffold6070_cov41-Cyclotella_meneghiniana.AAC.1